MEEKKKASPARVRANTKYNRKAYFQHLVRFPKNEESAIRAAAGDSLNAFIVSAVREKMAREGAAGPGVVPEEGSAVPE